MYGEELKYFKIDTNGTSFPKSKKSGCDGCIHDVYKMVGGSKCGELVTCNSKPKDDMSCYEVVFDETLAEKKKITSKKLKKLNFRYLYKDKLYNMDGLCKKLNVYFGKMRIKKHREELGIILLSHEEAKEWNQKKRNAVENR